MREVCSLMKFSFPLLILWKIPHSHPLRCCETTGHPALSMDTHRLDMLRTAWHFPIIRTILWYSITFYYMYLHPWTRPSSHSLHCCVSLRQTTPLAAGFYEGLWSSIIISSKTHSIQLPTFFIPSNHVLTSSDAFSFHSAFTYAYHKGKSIKTVIHSKKKKLN